MKRKIDNFFIEWKNDTAKKPLILFGPSQKTIIKIMYILIL